MFNPNKPILIVGTGVMGSLVAWATARTGIPVHAFDAQPGKAMTALKQALTWSEGEERSLVERNFQVFESLDKAVKSVQMAFENVFEDVDVKRELLEKLGALLSRETYMGSNTSSLVCSKLAASSGRPDRFFNMNFTDPRTSRLVELMGCPETAVQSLVFARAWARHIGMVPITVNKEQMGYSFNRLWRVIKKEVLRQVAEGYAKPEDIDRAWMLSFDMSYGPCGLMDMVSLPTIAKVEQQYYLDSGDPTDCPPEFLEQMIEAGKHGVVSGEGFYRYPDPAYRKPGWLDEES